MVYWFYLTVRIIKSNYCVVQFEMLSFAVEDVPYWMAMTLPDNLLIFCFKCVLFTLKLNGLDNKLM